MAFGVCKGLFLRGSASTGDQRKLCWAQECPAIGKYCSGRHANTQTSTLWSTSRPMCASHPVPPDHSHWPGLKQKISCCDWFKCSNLSSITAQQAEKRMSWSKTRCSVLIEQTFQTEEFCCFWLRASCGPHLVRRPVGGNDILSVRLVFSHLQWGNRCLQRPTVNQGARCLSVNTHASLEPQQNLTVEIENGPNGAWRK